MKKSLIISSLIVGLGTLYSCKKQYSCQCSTTFHQTGYSDYIVSTVEKNKTKTSKKTAEKICQQTEKQMTKNDADYISGNETVSVSCALKK